MITGICMITGIAIDKWKLSIFCKYLDAGLFRYEITNQSPDVMLLRVYCRCEEEKAALGDTIQDASDACKEYAKKCTH